MNRGDHRRGGRDLPALLGRDRAHPASKTRDRTADIDLLVRVGPDAVVAARVYWADLGKEWHLPPRAPRVTVHCDAAVEGDWRCAAAVAPDWWASMPYTSGHITTLEARAMWMAVSLAPPDVPLRVVTDSVGFAVSPAGTPS